MTKNKADYGYPVVDSFALNPFTTPGSAALLIKNADLQEAIQVDEAANGELARRIGVGVQVYDCVEGAWKGREPQANLYDIETGAQRGIRLRRPSVGRCRR